MMEISPAAKHTLANPMREKFAQALARGAMQCDAAIEAGYQVSATTGVSMPSRLARNERIQARVAEIINSSDYVQQASNVWVELMSAKMPEDEGSSKWAKVAEIKLKVIDQIARLGGWEPSKQVETKQLVLKGKVEDILPK